MLQRDSRPKGKQHKIPWKLPREVDSRWRRGRSHDLPDGRSLRPACRLSFFLSAERGDTVARSPFRSPDEVTHDVWAYLEWQYTAEEAEERYGRLNAVLKRLIRSGKTVDRLHAAMEGGVHRRVKHILAHSPEARDRERKREQARKDVARAAASLRQTLPPEARRSFSDDFLLDKRHELLGSNVARPPRRRGKPWDWKQETDAALKQAGVSASDRREVLAALGFIDDE